METYRENLEALQSPRSFKLFLIIGIFDILLSIYFLFHGSTMQLISGIFYLLTGVVFVIGYFVSKNRIGKLYVEFSESGIDARLTLSKRINLKWDDIKEIELKPISVKFILSNGKVEKVSFENLSYKNVLNLKDKVRKFANKFNVPII